MIRKITLFHKPIINHLTYLLVTFLLFFPKGGFKIGTIPITWGYLLLAGLGGFFALKNQFILTKERLIVLLCMLPFQVICLLSLVINGTASIGNSFAFFVNIIALPYIFLLLLAEPFEKIDQTFLFSMIKRGVFFVSCYGIALFFLHLLTGYFFETPLLTSNYHDSSTLFDKANNRGTVFKLISTYNNGNIYGICLLIFLPLYKTLEKNILKRGLVKFSLLLTLSRTVWMGLIFVELLYALYVNRNRYSLAKIGGFLIAFCIALLLIMKQFQFKLAFLLDKTFQGRAALLTHIEPVFFSSKAYTSGDPVYLVMLINFGVIGLLFYLLSMISGLFLGRANTSHNKAIVLGLTGYLFVSVSDGAFLYIPTLGFYWFLTSMLLRRASPQFASPSETLPS